MESEQRAFAFAPRASFARADFVPGAANEEALAWIERWPNWPGTALALWGPEGAGKSHLAAIWRARAEARSIPPNDLSSANLPLLLGEARAALVDPADRAVEEPLLHLFNLLAERSGHLLIVAREPPARWNIGLGDLRSRLVASPSVAIARPDDELLGALMVKLFADRQIMVSSDVIDYLLRHLERSFAAISEGVMRLDGAAFAEHKRVTIPLARRVFGLAEEESS